jgi:hypothetical protein
VNLLGFALSEDRLQLGKKSVKNLFQAQLPRTLKDLMKVLGMLNFCAPFVPDFKRKVAPLVQLMSRKNRGEWRTQHTEALNDLAQLIWNQFTLHLVDPEMPAWLYCDADEEHCSVVLA